MGRVMITNVLLMSYVLFCFNYSSLFHYIKFSSFRRSGTPAPGRGQTVSQCCVCGSVPYLGVGCTYCPCSQVVFQITSINMHAIPLSFLLVTIFAGFIQVLSGSSSLLLFDVSRGSDKVKVSTNHNTGFIIKLLRCIEDHSIFQKFILHTHRASNSKDSLNKMKYEDNLEKLIHSCKTVAKTYLEYPTSSYVYLGKDQNDGIVVCKLKNEFIISDNRDADRYPVVKSKVIIRTSIENMLSLLLNSKNVKLTNSYSLGRNDIEIISKNKKIVYNRSKIPIILQSHDYMIM